MKMSSKKHKPRSLALLILFSTSLGVATSESTPPGPPFVHGGSDTSLKSPQCRHVARSVRAVRGGAARQPKPRPNSKKAIVSKKPDVKTYEDGKSSMKTSIVNLVNNVAGAGILTLAAGKATGTGWIPAIAICGLLGQMSGNTFLLIGSACELTGEKNFKGLWSRTIGPSSTWILDGSIFLYCSAVSVVYSGILGDVWTPILKLAGLPDDINKRTSNILALTVFVLFPLSLLKNLSALGFTSVIGATAVLYTVLFIVVRAIDGTYSISEPLGKFVAAGIITKPSFAKSTLWKLDFTSLILMSNLGLAYIAHYNGPTYYHELENANAERFGVMVRTSFAILALIYIVSMCAGYLTFGDVCQGNIMLNYHPDDTLAILGRVATGTSILFGFPLVMRGAREGLFQVAERFGHPGIKQKRATVAAIMLTIVTLISINVDDVSLVVGLAGAVMGSFLVYICPSIIYTRAVKLVKGADSEEYQRARGNLVYIPFGAFIAGMGVYMTLKEKVFGK